MPQDLPHESFAEGLAGNEDSGPLPRRLGTSLPLGRFHRERKSVPDMRVLLADGAEPGEVGAGAVRPQPVVFRQHFLYLRPLPQGHASFGPILRPERRTGCRSGKIPYPGSAERIVSCAG